MTDEESCAHLHVVSVIVETESTKSNYWQCESCPMLFEPKRVAAKEVGSCFCGDSKECPCACHDLADGQICDALEAGYPVAEARNQEVVERGEHTLVCCERHKKVALEYAYSLNNPDPCAPAGKGKPWSVFVSTLKCDYCNPTHTNDCPRAAKLERRIIDHYYTKSYIDERFNNLYKELMTEMDDRIPSIR